MATWEELGGSVLAQPEQEPQNSTWGDVGQSAVAGAHQLGAQLDAFGRYVAELKGDKRAESYFRSGQSLSNMAAEDTVGGMTPEGSAQLNSSIISGKFWEHPASAALLKAANMSPGAAALVLPGAVLGPIVLAGIAGQQTAGQMLNELDQRIDAAKDEELMKNKFYAGLRATKSEEEAKAEYKQEVAGYKPAVNFLLGAAAGELGAAGKAAGALGGVGANVTSVGKSALQRAGVGALEGGIGGATQAGVVDASVQAALMKGGLQKDFDPHQFASAIADPTALGVLTGGALGARGKAAERVERPAEQTTAQETAAQPGEVQASTQPTTPAPPPAAASPTDQAIKAGGASQNTKGIGTGNNGPPPTNVDIGNTNSAPTRSETKYPKAAKAKEVSKAKEGVQVVNPGQPDAAQAAALAAKQPKVEQPAPEVTPTTPQLASPGAEPVSAPPPVAPVVEQRPVQAPQANPPAPQVAAPSPVILNQKPASITEPRAPRILPSLTPESKAAAEASKETARQVAENIKQMEAVPEEKPAGTKNYTKAEKEARAASAATADEIVNKHVATPAEDDYAHVDFKVGKPAREAVLARAQAMVDEAKAQGVKIPERLKGDAENTAVILRSAADLVKFSKAKKAPTKDQTLKAYTDFKTREEGVRSGSKEEILSERRAEGNQEMESARVASGNEVRGVSANTEEGVVRNKAGKLEKVERAKAASAVRKVELTHEQKAEIEARANKTVKGDAAKATSRGKLEKTPFGMAERVEDEQVHHLRDKSDMRRVNTNPSEAQKETGNYAKAHIKVHGIDVAIENPRYSERTGVGPDGKPWSVTMPDHYGYIKRTEGADGDHVDVYVGPNQKSPHVFVVDQHDANTSGFDEHKVMMGYPNAREAMEAYGRAFSDGRAGERVGNVTAMSVSEFKQWLREGNTKEQVGTTHEQEHSLALREGASQPFTVGHQDTGERATPLYSTTARQAMDSLNLENLAGVPKVIAPFVKRRLMELVGDVPVHVLSEADMARLDGARLENQGETLASAHNDAEGRRMHIRADVLQDPARTAHVVLHEAVHNATSTELNSSPHMRETITRMMNETAEHLADNPEAFHTVRYALTDPHEFLAEAFSNPKVQEILARVPVSAEVAARLGLGKSRVLSMWDAMVRQVLNVVQKITGQLPKGHTMIEAAMRAGEGLMAQRQLKMMEEGKFKRVSATREAVHRLEEETQGIVDKVLGRSPAQEQRSAPVFLKVRGMDSIAQVGDKYFGRENNPVRAIHDAMEMTRVTAQNLMTSAKPIVTKLFNLERKYKGTDWWEKLSTLMHDASGARVHPDVGLDHELNSHLGKDTLHGAWSKAQHPDLERRYRELPEDLRQAYHEAQEFYTKQQNAQSLGIIKNLLKLHDIEDDALAARLHTGTDTEADRALVGDFADKIKSAKELAVVKGPYYPKMRRGGFAVQGRYKVVEPSAAYNAKKLEPNVYEFAGKDARDNAIAYANSSDQELQPTLESVWVDKNTGSRFFTDANTGEQIKVHPNDADAEQRFHVALQDKHLDFKETEREAREAAFELKNSGAMREVSGVEPKRWEPGTAHGDMLSSEMQAMINTLKRRDSFKNMTDAQQNEMVRALHEQGLKYLGSTRIQTKRLPRRNVLGESKDITRNALEYAVSAASYLAKLKHRPALDAAMKEMTERVKGDYSDPNTLGRGSIAKEVEQRVAGATAFDSGPTNGKMAPWLQRLMTASFLDKLASPAQSVVNSTQVGMVTMPVLAGRFGVGKAFAEIGRAYNDIGGLSTLKSGFKDTGRKILSQESETSDLIGDIRGRIRNAGERDMIDRLLAVGSIDPEAGIEIAPLIKARAGDSVGSKVTAGVDKALGYMEGIARQMPRAIETINRSATALASYRLEMARFGDHERAVRYAQDTVNSTQFLYSHTNTAPIFNHPLFRIALQFKKYGAGIYNLLGMNIAKAFRGASREERIEGLKTLGMIAVTQTAVAGALGLPTEPFKFLLWGANAAGITDKTWGDLESGARSAVAGVIGPTAGELLMRGLPRAGGYGIDLSSRVGYDSLMTGLGGPKSTKADDVWAYVGKTMAGAPPGLVADWFQGANAAWAGDYSKAWELMTPVKMLSDALRSYREATEGKKNKKGQETFEPYTIPEAIKRTIGFAPAREAEHGEKAAAFYSQSGHEKGQRAALVSDWVSAKPADKTAAFSAVQKWNKGRPADAQIKMKELTAALTKRKNDALDDGLRVGKRNQHIKERVDQTYSAQ